MPSQTDPRAGGPTPPEPAVIWLLGRTQSGKTSLLNHLAGRTLGAVGQGSAPCTIATHRHDYPSQGLPIARFLDTQGIDEGVQVPQSSIDGLAQDAHLVILVAKVLDFSQSSVIAIAQLAREAKPKLPVLLALTCPHEAYPRATHPLPYPFSQLPPWAGFTGAERLSEAVQRHTAMWHRLPNRIVLVDFTPEGDGWNPVDYGNSALRTAILELLPQAYGQTLSSLPHLSGQNSNLPTRVRQIVQRSAQLAATSGGLPIPGADLAGVTGIQLKMLHDLGQAHGLPEDGRRLLEILAGVTAGALARRTAVSLVKCIPFVGSLAGGLAGAGLAYASTRALGEAYTWYCARRKLGQYPDRKEIMQHYQEYLTEAGRLWRTGTTGKHE